MIIRLCLSYVIQFHTVPYRSRLVIVLLIICLLFVFSFNWKLVFFNCWRWTVDPKAWILKNVIKHGLRRNKVFSTNLTGHALIKMFSFASNQLFSLLGNILNRSFNRGGKIRQFLIAHLLICCRLQQNSAQYLNSF